MRLHPISLVRFATSTTLGTAAVLLSLPAFAAQVTLPNGAILQPDTGNTSVSSQWRFAPGQVFGGVTGALDGVARLTFAAPDGLYACSGSLLQGGQYVLTAGHCADDFSSMTVDFGWFNGQAIETRTVTAAVLHPGWQGFDNSVDSGIDLAIVKLSSPVTTINGYALSTTNDVGKDFLMAGYGTTQLATTNSATNWNDRNYGHYAWNTVDVDSKTFNRVVDAATPGWGYDESYYVGTTYMADFDGPAGTYNTLGKVAGVTGGYTSNEGLGTLEGLIAGGDSGGGDFVLVNGQWMLSGVHSWGWQGDSVCGLIGGGSLTGCDAAANNGSSYGDLSGSTAVFDQAAWINSVIAVPEPGTTTLWFAGLLAVGGLVRRRTLSANAR